MPGYSQYTRQPGKNVPWPQNKMHVVDNVVSQFVPRQPAISASSTDLQFMINKEEGLFVFVPDGECAELLQWV